MTLRVVLVLAVLLLALGRCGCDAAAVNPGVPVPASRGACVDYEAMGGSLCSDRIQHLVYFIPDAERSFEYLENAIQAGIDVTALYATENCIAATVDYMCESFFPKCESVVVDGAVLALPNSMCRSRCESWWKLCSGMLEAATAYGIADTLSSCGTENHGQGPGDAYGVKLPQDRQKAFPDGLQNELFFPEVFNTWTSPDDASVQVKLACATPSIGNVSANVSHVLECNEDVMVQYDIGAGAGKRCQFLCPHPLFSKGEYSLMRLLYVVPGLVGGGLCAFLLVDSIRMTFSRSKAARGQRKEAMYQFQAIVGLCGTAFLVLGPASMVIGGDVGCNGLPVLPGVVDAAYVPQESVMCVLNRASVFAVLGLFNAGYVQMITTYGMLQRATQMHVARDKKADQRRTRRLLFVALAVPAGLCAAMYALDDLDRHSSSYQAQLARWSLICGPRLTAAQELALVYVPFTFTGFLVTLQSLRSWRLMRKLISLSNNAVAPATSSTSSKAGNASSASSPLHALNQKVTLLGLLCAVSLVIFVVATSQLVPAFAKGSNQFVDWYVCVTTGRDIPVIALTTVDSCGELFAITGDISLRIKDATLERPSPELLAMSFFAETLTVCIFGAFYTSFVIKRRRKVSKRQHSRERRSSRVKALPGNSS